MRVDSWQPPYKVHSPPSPWQDSLTSQIHSSDHEKNLDRSIQEPGSSPGFTYENRTPSPGLKRSGEMELGSGEGSQ